MIITTSGLGTPRAQILTTAEGVLSETFHPALIINAASPATQTVYGLLLGLRGGDLVTGIKMRLNVAAAGTAPTLGRFGIADSTGKTLAISGDLGAASNWTIGSALFPFAAQYTVPSDGGYFATFVVNGTWGSTQPTLGEAGATAGPTNLATPVVGYRWAGQTDLPAVGNTATLTSGLNLGFYIAFY